MRYRVTATINVDDVEEVERYYTSDSLDDVVSQLKAEFPTAQSVVFVFTL